MEENKVIDYRYIGVRFEDKWNPGKFYGNVYNYKTTQILKEGQVISVPTTNINTGETKYSKAQVVRANVNPNTIDYPLENIKEI